jgi:hypothetical protein
MWQRIGTGSGDKGGGRCWKATAWQSCSGFEHGLVWVFECYGFVEELVLYGDAEGML